MRKAKHLVFLAAGLAAITLTLVMLPVLASNGDYGVNTGNAAQSCPAGYVWYWHTTTQGSCVATTATAAPTATTAPPTAVPPTMTPWPTNTAEPTSEYPTCGEGQALRKRNGQWVCITL